MWDLNYIFEEDHHIDKQELTIDSLSLSSRSGVACTVTRSSIGVWDIMQGSLRSLVYISYINFKKFSIVSWKFDLISLLK